MEADANTQIAALKEICPAEFELTDLLGSGGYGIVVKAKDKLMGRTVAIKFISNVDGDKDSQHKKFKQEGVALARLKHENIVSVLQMGIGKDDRPFIVYEYLEGRTLKAFLEEQKVLSPRLLSSIFEQILAGLSHAHSMGVVHGDISPSNIILLDETQSSTTNTARVKVKIVDFGLARIVEGEQQPNTMLTASNSTQSLRGNPFYMSPEQCRGEAADKRSDYYSMACVFYECLTGKPPFSGETPLHILYMHLNERPQLASDLPASLKELLRHSLAKEKSDRFENTAQFRSQLQRAIDDLKKRDPESRRLNKVLLAAAVVLCLSGTIAMVLLKNQKSMQKSLMQNPKLNQDSKPADMNMSPTLRLKKSILEVWHILVPDKSKNIKLLARFKQLLPLVKEKGLLYSGFSAKGIIERQLEKYSDAKKSQEQAYMLSLINGRESLQSVNSLFEIANLLKSYFPSVKKSELKDRYKHILFLIEEFKNDKLPTMELEADLDLIDVGLIESISLIDLMNLTDDVEESIRLGKEAIAASKGTDALAHACNAVMPVVDLLMAKRRTHEGLALVAELEKSMKTETCKDPLDQIASAEKLANFYEKRGNLKKSEEMVDIGLAIAKEHKRELGPYYANLSLKKQRYEKNPN